MSRMRLRSLTNTSTFEIARRPIFADRSMVNPSAADGPRLCESSEESFHDRIGHATQSIELWSPMG